MQEIEESTSIMAFIYEINRFLAFSNPLLTQITRFTFDYGDIHCIRRHI